MEKQKNKINGEDIIIIGFFLLPIILLIMAAIHGFQGGSEVVSPGIYKTSSRCEEEAGRSFSNTGDDYYCDYDFKDGEVIYMLKRRDITPY